MEAFVFAHMSQVRRRGDNVMRFAFEGTLDVSVNDKNARLIGRDRTLEMDIDDPAAFFRSAGIGGLRTDNLRTLRQAAQTLYDLGLTLRVLHRGQMFLIIGYEAQPGLSGQFAPHVQIAALDAARYGLALLTA